MFERLETLYSTRRDRRILSQFDDPKRFQNFSAESDDLLLDYSKTNLDDEVMDALIALAETRGVFAKRDAMFEGEAINDTEGRAVLHTALRANRDDVVMVDGENVVKTKVYAVLDKMFAFARDIRDGKITASNGKAFTDVVNIGIGGSDLGPVMAVEALAPYCDGPRTHFVSNVDGAHIHDVLAKLDPETTLVIIASKTFTTIETMTNAATARKWLAGVASPDAHFVAISTAMEKTAAFGIAPSRVFGFEDWVGGRYSLWGPIGLSILLAIGEENFIAFLAGGNAMDRHFREASPRKNLPLLLGLIGIWHRNICDYATRAILPYDQHLSRFPAYLQQLDMESNGKSVAIDGARLNYETGPVVWGEPGTNGQHAFYQLIHQGTDIIPCEFFIAKTAHEPDLTHHHDLLKANCLAQSEALMIGRDFETARKMMAAKGYAGAELERQARHRVFEGNRPSLTIAYSRLTPFVLGQLIALYEHRVFVEGVIWGINSFDQWGVELGKELANALLPMVEGKASATGKDGSTQGLLAKLGD